VPILLADVWTAKIWYSIPLVVAISLVYAASKHELTAPLLRTAWQTAVWMLSFMGFVLLMMWMITWDFWGWIFGG